MGVLVQTSERIRIVSLNRPSRHNALDDATLDELPLAMQEASSDPSIDVILLRGEGPSFCSGRDVSVLDPSVSGEPPVSTSGIYETIRHHQDQRLMQLGTAKPIVSALKGYVIGGGLELALATDIRIGATDATLSLPEVTYGISPDTGGAVLATILAGPSRAKLLLMTGRRIDAQTALAWGLIDELVEPAELDERALDLCHEIAGQSRAAVQIIKQLVDQTWDGAIKNGIRTELLALTALYADPKLAALLGPGRAAP